MGFVANLRGMLVPDEDEAAELDALLGELAGSICAPFAVCAGQHNLSLSSGTDSGALAITFPTPSGNFPGFTQTPIVIASCIDSANNGLWGTADAVTTTGCNLRLHSRSSITTTRPVTYLAVQMLSTSAAG